MLTINQILKNKMSEKLIHKKCKNIDLTFLFPELETYVEVLNNMGIEFEYSIYFHKSIHSITTFKYEEGQHPDYYRNNFTYLLYSSGVIPFIYFEKSHTDITGDTTYYFNVYKPYLVFTLHFPKFIITNKFNHKSEIKDFFIRFYIGQDGNIKDGELQGSRTTYTTNELKAGYRHSHLQAFSPNTPIKSQLINFTRMCLGHGTEIHAAMAHLQNAVMINDNIGDFFELFIRNIISVIQYESIEGTPYIKMEKIKEVAKEAEAKSNPYNTYYKANHYVTHYLSSFNRLNSLHEYLFHYHDSLQLEFNEESEYIIFDEVVNNHLEAIKLDSDLKQFIKVEVNNRLLNLDQTEIASNATTDQYYIEFNNKKYYLTIDDTVKLEDNNFKYVFSPIFKNYVKQVIKTRYISSIFNYKKDLFAIPGAEGDSAYCPF